MDNYGKNHLDPERLPKRNHLQQLWTDNTSTYNVEKYWLHGLKKKSITLLYVVDYFWENRKDVEREQE